MGCNAKTSPGDIPGRKIEGAIQLGREWMIPKNMNKPLDGRTKAGKKNDAEMPSSNAPPMRIW